MKQALGPIEPSTSITPRPSLVTGRSLRPVTAAASSAPGQEEEPPPKEEEEEPVAADVDGAEMRTQIRAFARTGGRPEVRCICRCYAATWKF